MKRMDTKALGMDVHIVGNVIRIARIAEGYDFVDDPEEMVRAIRESGSRADIFTFLPPLTEPSPAYYFPMEWDNLAAT